MALGQRGHHRLLRRPDARTEWHRSTEGFYNVTAGKIATVADAPVTALEDASLSTWIRPSDGSGYIYYPKGSLAGFMLDVLIRDGSNNRKSLDTVMRELYQSTYKRGRGFTGGDWWPAVSRAAGGKSFTGFAAKYVDGREPYPWDRILPLAGLRALTDTIREPRLGISAGQDSGGVVVRAVQPGSVAEEAGVKTGDVLIALGDLTVTGPGFGDAFRAKFSKHEGDSLPIKVRRDASTLTLAGKVRLATRTESRIVEDSSATDKAIRIRHGIVTGKTE